MEIMIKIMGFRHLRLKTKQETTLYSSVLGYNDSYKTSFLLSLTDLAHFAIHSLWFSTIFQSS